MNQAPTTDKSNKNIQGGLDESSPYKERWNNFVGEGYADFYLTTTRLWPVSNIRVWPVGLFAETLVTWTVLSPLFTA